MASDWARIEQAAAKYGHTLDAVAGRYTNPVTGKPLSGEALILKTIKGESGGRRDAVSSAGARAWAQFMPGTRASFIKEFGVDAWRSPEEAVHALTLHMRGKGGHPTGLEGYNPGDPNYPAYILNQKVGAGRGGGRLGGSPPATGSGQASAAGPQVPAFDPGQATSLPLDLGQGPTPPPVSVPALPSFAAAPPSPAAAGPLQVPSSGVPQPSDNGLAAKLDAIAQLGGGELPQAQQQPGQQGAAGGSSGGSGGQQVGSGRTPTAKVGKIIGTPYTGTHTLGNWQSDNAIDIAVPVGTPMVALQDGEVVKVKHHPQGAGRFAGDQITVRGANGNEYFYAHGVAHVKAGQKIRRGESLGTTGSANGVAHLHFGQMKGDPRQHAGR